MKIQRIKKSITEKEYKKLMAYARGDEDIKEFNQKRFFKIFSLLYYSGLRVNEITQIKYSHVDDIIQNGETVVISHKTKMERVLYFSESAIKEIKKYFTYAENELDNFCITSWGNPKKTFHEISLIQLVNKYMKQILGTGFTSHSFRQGLITEMGSRSVNPRIIQSFIGHKNINTTLGYIRPTEDDIKNSLVR
ncbi:tyrosine-type recombinase/integrase [Candidatus Sulfurimonas baltica]|uniref:Site-specific integrase n=1 Tax=Candidatus Sulfurimonas baltica TaxID=2740404 RepID=A0A7S7RMP4_9BACT|nr:site-specific integrase [Candidatus Sulfurimonas baltica]QOY52482.1 site-specific integrase [Candidatus Sulfurimonas baltica]